jgi:hypothetical protein
VSMFDTIAPYAEAQAGATPLLGGEAAAS